jgi:hypothetical protein
MCDKHRAMERAIHLCNESIFRRAEFLNAFGLPAGAVEPDVKIRRLHSELLGKFANREARLTGSTQCSNNFCLQCSALSPEFAAFVSGGVREIFGATVLSFRFFPGWLLERGHLPIQFLDLR